MGDILVTTMLLRNSCTMVRIDNLMCLMWFTTIKARTEFRISLKELREIL